MVARKGRPTCFIHIGPPKTGSSTISHFVEGNVETFAAQGLYVPQMPALKGRPMNGHGIFANVDEINAKGELRAKALLWPELEEVAAEGRRNIVLTSESFAHAFRDSVVLDRILTFFERHAYDVTIIAYLRDQPSSLNSSYVQSQKRLVKRMTFEEFVDEAARSGKVDPWRYLEHVIDNPRLSFDAGCFETAIKTSLEKDFAKRLGLPDGLDLNYPEVRNPNAGAKAVFAAQQILEQIGDVRVSKLAGFKKINRRFKKHFEERGWTEAPYVGLDQELYGRIRDYYGEANERFSKRFFGASWKKLSPDRSYVKKEFDPSTASKAELAEIEEVVTDVVGMIQGFVRQQADTETAIEADVDDRGQAKTRAERKARRQLKKKRRARAAKASGVVAKSLLTGGADADEVVKGAGRAGKGKGRGGKGRGGKGRAGKGRAGKGGGGGLDAKATTDEPKRKGLKARAAAPAEAAAGKASVLKALRGKSAGGKSAGNKAAGAKAAATTRAAEAADVGRGPAAKAAGAKSLSKSATKTAAKTAAADKPKKSVRKAAAKAADTPNSASAAKASAAKASAAKPSKAKGVKAGAAKRPAGAKDKAAQAAE